MTLDEFLKTHEPLIMYNANDGDYHIICNCWSHDELHEWDYVGHLKKVLTVFVESLIINAIKEDRDYKGQTAS